ncbi:MAG: electron transfer flavoprotein subunit beta/FixA family protein [Deltaproteobacteria bacterium]|nr:electron transfer flavoprotein subunit beta/FixA family protein [Deltaproteobacteria bacterium]
MRIVVCVKEVLDPDAVNSLALAGRLQLAGDGRTLVQDTIPTLMNGFDEQALEAALRIRDAGVSCSIAVVSVGGGSESVLRHAAALGADELAAIQVEADALDPHAVACLLAAWIRNAGGADLVLCGRQASDDDQGVVPALLGERLGLPVVTVARAVEWSEAGGAGVARVTRATPDGDERVEVPGPAVVTVSNELGAVRYPTAARKLQARRMKPAVVTPAELGLAAGDWAPRVRIVRQFVPALHGRCELVEGASAAEVAERLVGRLREEGVLAT